MPAAHYLRRIRRTDSEAGARTGRRRPEAWGSRCDLSSQLLGVLRYLSRGNSRRSHTHLVEPKLSRARSALPVGELKRRGADQRWALAAGNQSCRPLQPPARFYHAIGICRGGIVCHAASPCLGGVAHPGELPRSNHRRASLLERYERPSQGCHAVALQSGCQRLSIHRAPRQRNVDRRCGALLPAAVSHLRPQCGSEPNAHAGRNLAADASFQPLAGTVFDGRRGRDHDACGAAGFKRALPGCRGRTVPQAASPALGEMRRRPLAPELGRRFTDLTGILVCQGYGMTEPSPVTHVGYLEPELYKPESIGQPLAQTDCRIVNTSENEESEVTRGEPGELVMRGPQFMMGYWKDPQATAAVLHDGWFWSGDIVKRDANDFYYVVDRRKEMIKYKGFPVAPAEVEALLLEHPAVRDCGVVGRADSAAGEIPVAFIVLREGSVACRKLEEDLCGFVAERLTSYKQPRQIHFVDVLPRTPSGKILRRELRKIFSA